MTKVKRFFASAPLLLTLSACGPALPPNTNGVLYCSEGNPESFNPQMVTSATTLDMTSLQLYDTLVEYDAAKGSLQPGLATDWQISDDGHTYEFTLRENVAFHHTDYFTPSRPFNAEDVLFSFQRWLDPEHPYHSVSGGRYPFFRATRLDQLIASISAPRPNVVRIQLHQPDSSLMSTLSSSFAVILSAEYGQQLLDKGLAPHIDQRPIGTGPFKFRHFRPDVSVYYQAHQEHWRGAPASDSLVFRITPSNHKRMLMLLTGDCDISPYPPARDIAWLQQRDDMNVQQSLSPNTAFWAFNTEVPPFDNPLVRKALSHAIDRDALIHSVYHDHAVRADSILPHTSWAQLALPDAYQYDPEKARALLAEAGYADGFSMDIWALPVQRSYNPNPRLMAEQIQSYLAQIGVTANIVSYEWRSFRRLLAQGKHDSVLIGWSADHSDPDNFFRPILTCAAKRSINNRALWCNAEFDALVTAAIRTTDISKRQLLYERAQKLLAEQVPIVPLAHSIRYQVSRRTVRNMLPPSLSGIRFHAVYSDHGLMEEAAHD
ncbi:ABC transporter substrate-binding protein [Aliidiomarina taiwanensis]|uniref:ABC transporter substrate-binding protein n=1 Tax=Aliidiomarina taiwanensis TaxID=946228 RepID=A0A432XAX1_9GAMM|nr:ABC transporter substrate-binding protein [Aliidiomarina taiwanensis]